MPSMAERVLVALHARLRARLPLDVAVVRNVAVPTRVPPAGWVCLRDGDPGPPEVIMSPLTFIYEHEAELDIIVDALPADRDARFDAIKVLVGAALAQDRTLGGLCDYVIADAPVSVDIPVDGGPPLKAATVGILLTYATADPLG